MSLSSPEPPHGDADFTPEEAPPSRNARTKILGALPPHDLPPHDVDLERELLGAMVFTAENDAAIVAAVAANDFYFPAHRLAFDASSPCIDGASRRAGFSLRMSCGGMGTSRR